MLEVCHVSISGQFTSVLELVLIEIFKTMIQHHQSSMHTEVPHAREVRLRGCGGKTKGNEEQLIIPWGLVSGEDLTSAGNPHPDP